MPVSWSILEPPCFVWGPSALSAALAFGSIFDPGRIDVGRGSETVKPIELHEDDNGYLHCPVRGDIDVQWCLGCPQKLRVSYEGERAVIHCDPDSEHPHDQAATLRDVPESFRTS